MRSFFLSVAFLVASTAMGETFTVKTPADLPESFTCASVYSDVGAPVDGDPIPGVEGELLALTVHREKGDSQLTIESFIPQDAAWALLHAVAWAAGDYNPNGLWKDVRLRDGRILKACTLPCELACNCVVVYYPNLPAIAPEISPEISWVEKEDLPGLAKVSCFSIWGSEKQEQLLLSGQRFGDMWQVTARSAGFSIDQLLQAYGPGMEGHSGEGDGKPFVNGVFSTVQVEIAPGLWTDIQACVPECGGPPPMLQCDCFVAYVGWSIHWPFSPPQSIPHVTPF